MKTDIYRHRPSWLDETLTDAFGIEIYFSETSLKAIFYAGKSSKSWWFYRFKTLDEMIKRIYESVDRHIERENEKIQRRAKQKNAMSIFKAADHFNVGDVVVNTWGWEQTNVEFYQVTEVLNKKIKVREIGCKTVENSHGFMSCDVLPDIDNFVKDTRKEINLLSLKADINANGEISCRICNPESYYYFHKWGGTAQYMSWYA